MTPGVAAVVDLASDEEKQEIAKVVDLPIIYLDDQIIIVDKPYGLNSIPGNKLVTNGGRWWIAKAIVRDDPSLLAW